MDAPVEVAVARKHCRGIEVARDDLLLNLRVQRTAHAVAGGAGKSDNAEAELLQLREQARLLQVKLHRLRARRQRGLHPRLAHQAPRIRIARQQAGGNDVARVAGVRARRNGRNDDRAIGHLARRLGPRGSNAACRQVRSGQTLVRVRRASHVAHYGAQVEVQRTFVLRSTQAVRPQAGRLRICLHQLHLRVFTAGQAQVVQRLVVDEEHGGRSAIFWGHVGDGGAVAERERSRAFALELQIRTDHLFLAQEFGEREHYVGRRNARRWPARELHAHDIRQAHPRGAAQHHVLCFQPTHTDGDDAERIHMRRMAVRAHERVREGDAVLRMDHRRHSLQIDLVHDAVARRNDLDVLERFLRPVDEVEAVFVAPVFHGAVLRERVLVEAGVFHC